MVFFTWYLFSQVVRMFDDMNDDECSEKLEIVLVSCLLKRFLLLETCYSLHRKQVLFCCHIALSVWYNLIPAARCIFSVKVDLFWPETYSESSQTSKMECFAKIVNGFWKCIYSDQRRIQDPVKHLKWSVLRK